MNILFYITNHGYGHASRNVPIIKEMTKRGHHVFIKSDRERIKFLKLNLLDLNSVKYYNDIGEVGLLLVPGHMYPDIVAMKLAIIEDKKKWPLIIEKEIEFIVTNKIEFVISDTVALGIRAAKLANIRNVLIGNFDWAMIYKEYYDISIWRHYLESYRMADFAMWYDLHSTELHLHNDNYISLSLISRPINYLEVKKIVEKYKKPIVFVSLGGSASLEKEIDVSNLEYDFLITKGINLKGENVHVLPSNLINTPDYIAASDYVIAKGGWSTVAEILLQRKKAVLIMRSNNPEDARTKEILMSRRHCIAIDGEDTLNFEELLEDLSNLHTGTYDMYCNDCLKICDTIELYSSRGKL